MSRFQVCDERVHVVEARRGGVAGEGSGFVHRGKRFRTGSLTRDSEGQALRFEGLADKNIEGRRQVHAEVGKECLGIFFQRRVHADADICCRCNGHIYE